MREQRKLAAVLAADVVGYSRLMGRDESGTLARLRENRSERFNPVLTKYGGRLVKLTGDGALVEFASAVDALSAAIEFQQTMAEANRGQPADTALVFRMGLHLGDMIVDGDDLYGDGVNIAARLEAEAPAGGMVISRTVHEAVAGRVKASFDDLGSLPLKNIERPVQAFSVKWEPSDWQPPVTSEPTAARATAPEAPLPLPDKPSIAVLAFQNMSGDPDQEYFVDGLVEDIITALSRISAFFVIARNSSFTYRGRAVDVRQVGRELGVRYVLEGSVRKAGGRLRITGQLVDTTTGNHIWAERYEGALDAVFDLQDRITSSVVAVIEPKVRQAEILRAQAKSTENLTAYDLYLRAYALFTDHNYKEESFDRALEMLARAVAIDPHFSSAYGLVVGYHVQRLNRGWGSVADIRAQGLHAAKLAAETGRDDPRALGWAANGIARFGGHIGEAITHIERALTLSPDSTHVRRMGGFTYVTGGEHERSIEHYKRAIQLDPLDPWAFEASFGIAFPYFFTQRYEEALSWLEKALLERPNLIGALRLKIAASAMADRTREEIQQAIGRLHSQHPDISITKIVPIIAHFRQVDLDHYVNALRLAGLPE
jgi:adenylate cyclase